MIPDAVRADHTVSVGVGSETNTTINVSKEGNDNKVLVPEGRVKDAATQTDSITLQFNVKWNSDNQAAKGTEGKLKISHKVSEDSSLQDLSLFEITHLQNLDIIADEEVKVIEVTVTLNEPENRAQYEEVINNELKLDFSFSVELVD